MQSDAETRFEVGHSIRLFLESAKCSIVYCADLRAIRMLVAEPVAPFLRRAQPFYGFRVSVWRP